MTLVWTNAAGRGETIRATLEVPTEPVSLDGAPLKGTGSARTVMMVFADFECPYCGRFARDVLPVIESEFVAPGKLDILFRHLPLPSHSNAINAAVTAECAGQQGQFWSMHDRLFALGRFDNVAFHDMASGLPLDPSSFVECLDRGVPEVVSRDANQAARFGLRSTPTFLFGTRSDDGHMIASKIFAGALPLPEFRREVEQAIESGKNVNLFWLVRLFR